MQLFREDSGAAMLPNSDPTVALCKQTSQLCRENLTRADSAVAQAREGDEKSQIQLKRNMGLWGAVSLVVGAIIGSGLFMMPSLINQYTGNSPYMSLTVWAIGGLVAFLGAICYAELATSITVSGGEQAYLTKMYCPMIGFLFVWTNTLILNPGGLAVISLYCAEFITVNIYQGYSMNYTSLDSMLEHEVSPYATSTIALVILLIVSVVNAFSSDFGNKCNEVLALVKVLAIAVICCIGIHLLAQGEYEQFQTPYITPNETTYNGVIQAVLLIMWAYGGWSFLSWVTEEIVLPSRNIPLSLFIGIGIVLVVYLLFNIALFCGPPLVNYSNIPFILVFAKTTWGGAGWGLATFCIISATFGSVSSNTISITRFYHACSRDGHLPRFLSLCIPSRSTPICAIIFNFATTAVFVLMGEKSGDLVDKVMYTQWVFFTLVFVGILVLRVRRPTMIRPFRAPILVPIVASIMSIVMLCGPFFDPTLDWKALLAIYSYTIMCVVTGVPFYFLCVRRDTRIGFVTKISGSVTSLCRRLGAQ